VSDLARIAPRTVLASLLEAPDLPALVPRLAPEQLHRIIAQEGLEACAPLIVHATPEQLTQLADLDLWRSGRAGADAAFDADRFLEWLGVLLDQGAPAAARTLASMDAGVVAAGVAASIRVLDWAAVSAYPHTDGELFEPMPALDTSRAIELGSFLIVPRAAMPPEVILAALRALEEEAPACFADVMQRCRARSNAACEVDGLDELLDTGRQALHDLGASRSLRREAHGFATPADARAFLQAARQRPVDPRPTAAAAAGGALAQDAALRHLRDYAATSGDTADAHAEALAFLANALVAGCAVQGRPLTPPEASDAAAATCNLGLARWLAAGARPPGLVAAFELGWAVLHREVALEVAAELIALLPALRHAHVTFEEELQQLQRELTRHWRGGAPWLAREPLEVLAALDAPAWAAIDALVAECPVLHDALRASLTPGTRAVDPQAFAFIADEADIDLVRRFAAALPRALGSVSAPAPSPPPRSRRRAGRTTRSAAPGG
jgi:hypothetical protein